MQQSRCTLALANVLCHARKLHGVTLMSCFRYMTSPNDAVVRGHGNGKCNVGANRDVKGYDFRMGRVH
eukprot:5768222-Prymnesium_polylepis.1